ncbi:MAG: hypothetical protein R3B72_46075 [Polyangiaceae bacterium]
MSPPKADPELAERDDEGDEAESSRPPLAERPWARRLLPLLLLGLVLAVAPLWSELQMERELVFRLPEGGVTALEASVSQGEDLIWSTTRRFDAGDMPEAVSRKIRLAPGRYQVVAVLETREGRRQVARTLDVGDDASQVVIPLP